MSIWLDDVDASLKRHSDDGLGERRRFLLLTDGPGDVSVTETLRIDSNRLLMASARPLTLSCRAVLRSDGSRAWIEICFEQYFSNYYYFERY